MKAITINGILLIVILAVLGWSLAEDAIAYHRLPERESQKLIDTNKRLAFHSATGIDIAGRLFDADLTAKTQLSLVFLLRNTSD